MKLIYILPILLIMTAGSGCNKYLDRKPIGLITEDQINTTPTLAVVKASVSSSYQLLSSTLNLIGEWNWDDGTVLRNDFILQDMASDDMLKKWNPDGDQAWMDQISNFNFTSFNGGFSGIWSYDYEGITRCNQAIMYLTDPEVITIIGIDEALKNRLLGESYFLRAFYYFDLVNNFGDVPILIKPLESFEEAYAVAKREPKEKVWELISSDLSSAVSLLPNAMYSDNTEKWRVSKGAAIAMQAKVALFNKQWDDVLTHVSELQALHFYDLNDSYFDNFNYRKEFTDQEVIFAYDHQTGLTPARGNGLCALLGWGFVAPTQNFINAFEANDPRLLYTVNVATQSIYKILGDTTDQFKGNDDAPSNKIYIRYADVLLWQAEAYLEKNNLPAAIGIINDIRARARTTPIAGTNNTLPPGGTLPDRDVNTADKATVKQWLMHERRVELGFESQRFNDLKRWGIAKDVLRALGKNFQDNNYVYPIPQGEVDKSGGTIVPNP